jgi:hypothetical protein
MKNDWNEPELRRHLSPVQAPDELWDRVQGADSSQRVYALRSRKQAGSVWQWAAAALATVAIAAGITVWQNRAISGEERAVRALSRTPDQLDFRSENLTEVRTWVKSGTGLDVPMPGQTSPAVRMIGALVNKAGVPTAEIAYRVGDADVSLVVSRIPQEGDGRHQFVKSGSYHGSSFQSWTMRGQMYTIASADAKVGCLLCHSTGAPRTSVN